ncbi:MAG TPA: hypothetical protein VN609_05525 [Propionibacteriaceae bacterium]|nr:hypothetical protein [Propionibacteriaceae bacterium]
MQTIVAIEPEFLDKKTTCQVLGGISVDRLEALMRAGEIVPKTIGRHVVFPTDEVRRFAREYPTSWEPKRHNHHRG